MNAGSWIAILIVTLLIGYLTMALLKPEKF